jgi:hypothetical protein
MSTPIENIERAIAIMQAVPEKDVNLAHFLVPAQGDCGTLACCAGWLAQDKFFQDQGMTLAEVDRSFGTTSWCVVPQGTNQFPEDWEWLDALFGEDAFARLFEPYGCGEWDTSIIAAYNDRLGEDEDGDPSDKELALERLRHQLNVLRAEATA